MFSAEFGYLWTRSVLICVHLDQFGQSLSGFGQVWADFGDGLKTEICPTFRRPFIDKREFLNIILSILIQLMFKISKKRTIPINTILITTISNSNKVLFLRDVMFVRGQSIFEFGHFRLCHDIIDHIKI